MGHLKVANRLGDTKSNQFANINKTDSPQRSFSLGCNHITTANFGDLIPAYWCETRPRDKFELDCNILAKFLALIAPAYCKADITVDWFFVPTKLISPRSLDFISRQTIDAVDTQSNNIFDINSEVYGSSIIVDKNKTTGQTELYGIPRVNASLVNDYLCANNGQFYSGKLYGLEYYLEKGAPWLTPPNASSGLDLGLEDLNCFGNKYRISRLLDYFGIPKSVSTYAYVDDVASFINESHITSEKMAAFYTYPIFSYEHKDEWFNPVFMDLFNYDAELFTSLKNNQYQVGFINETGTQTQTATLSALQAANYVHYNWTGATASLENYLMKTCPRNIRFDLRPFMAYQKIYNDFYRDPVKQNEVRLYDQFVCLAGDDSRASSYTNSIGNTLPETVDAMKRLFNNLLSLRRRNYDKDWLNNSLLSTQLINQSNVNYQPFNSRFLNNLYKFSLKKAVTGNRYFDFLANFMDSYGNDYLTNMVTYIGGNRFPITISETVQTSSSDSTSPQGNRSGNMNAYQNTNKHYFSAPDYGYIFCIVSLLPKISYFNGFPQRLRNLTMLAQDLPDFNNIGFSPVSSDELKVNRSTSHESTVFGYLPFGYQWKFQPDMVTGDFSKSLSYWHQSPDLDSSVNLSGGKRTYNSSFTGKLTQFLDSPLTRPYPNNANFPAVGLRQVNNNLLSNNEYYNNIFAVTTDASGDHCQLTMDFYVNCSRAMSENEILVDDGLI